MATRGLRKVYFDVERCPDTCLGRSRDTFIISSKPEDGTNGHDCFHQKSISMLNWLQIKAWSEVRANLMLTVGSKLPADLVEYLFMVILELEGIPVDPQTKEKIACSESMPSYDSLKDGGRELFKLRMQRMYRCACFEQRFMEGEVLEKT